MAEDGGTIVVPYFHRYMSKWCEVHKKIRKNLPWVTLPKDVEGMYMPYAQRISMKEVNYTFGKTLTFFSWVI